MNRWRARLAELQGEAFALPVRAQNVQIVQKSRSVPTFEHFEQFEQRPDSAWAAEDGAWTDAIEATQPGR
jgi:hypothetical protein